MTQMTHTQDYLCGAAQARADRKYREPARYRVQAGDYQFRNIRSEWFPVGCNSLAERARGYLETFYQETLYV